MMLVACATGKAPKEPIMLAPPAVVAPSDWQTVHMMARLARVLDLAVPATLRDGIVRWEVTARDQVHSLEVEVVAAIDQAGVGSPDLTVLSIDPVAHTESSGFGWRDDPIRHTRNFHSGTDFRGEPGTRVVAAGDGMVTFCGRMGGYGNMVVIDHGGGVVTRYAHLRRIETTKDSLVTAGDTIGQVGSTGRATGPHLHFEVRLDGAPVSPISAMTIAALQRESPLAGRLAALSLAPEIQATATSDVDPPKQRAAKRDKSTHRPERAGRGKRQQVLW
jgi:murein DD-endopeptidase MepM/ murein hydrolase activator NlpD